MTGAHGKAALAFGLLAAFFWGTHSVIVRALTADLDAMTIAVLRLYIASAALYLILRVNRYRVRFDFKDRAFLLTCFGAISNYIFFHLGLEHTGANNAMMLENTAPIFVLLILLFRGEKARFWEIAACVTAFIGVYFTVRNDLILAGDDLLGDLLEIMAGLTWAIFILGSSRALARSQTTFDRIGFLFRVFLVSAIILTPTMLIAPEPPSAVTMQDVVLLLLLGIFPTAIAYYLWYEAAAKVSPITSALLFTLTIIFTFLNAYLFLGEGITPNMAIGALLIVSAVLISRIGAQAKG